ncbi:hypothetical protein ACQPYK_48680 (plasmid) [Streptosporangium sp. CA-135522]|uniref:hypothetical protein n=1 Tax=Streptosporangium sp. CA-135522 TaxID=3240072 RepID=UPI003D8C8871
MRAELSAATTWHQTDLQRLRDDLDQQRHSHAVELAATQQQTAQVRTQLVEVRTALTAAVERAEAAEQREQHLLSLLGNQPSLPRTDDA